VFEEKDYLIKLLSKERLRDLEKSQEIEVELKELVAIKIHIEKINNSILKFKVQNQNKLIK
jgi:hypothetical protein